MDRLDDFRLGSDPEPPPGQEPERGSRAPHLDCRAPAGHRRRRRGRRAVEAAGAGAAGRRKPAQATAAPQTEARDAPGARRRAHRSAAARADRSARPRTAGQAVVEPDAGGVAGHRRPHPGLRRVGRERGGRHVAGQARAGARAAVAVPHASTRAASSRSIRDRSARYDGIANAAASMDPAGLARVYSMLKPRLVEAYKELGHPEGDLDVAVERAIVHLLQTPVVEEPIVAPAARAVVQVRPRGPRGAVAGPEAAAADGAAQRARSMQDQLRAVARELGIPSSRLPPPAPA